MFNTFDKTHPLRRLTILLSVAPILFFAGCGEVYVHEEFEKNIMNKSEAEVVERIGKPTTVDGNDRAHVSWTYYAKTFDVDNGNKRDSKTVLTLEPDAATKALKVVKITYQKG